MLIETHSPSIVAEGTRVRGDLTFFSAAGVFGLIEGTITQQSLELIQVGKSGWVHGSIDAEGPVLIEGRVDGDIVSRTRVALTPTATVLGTIDAPTVSIRAGAIFEGGVATRQVVAKALKKAA